MLHPELLQGKGLPLLSLPPQAAEHHSCGFCLAGLLVAAAMLPGCIPPGWRNVLQQGCQLLPHLERALQASRCPLKIKVLAPPLLQLFWAGVLCLVVEDEELGDATEARFSQLWELPLERAGCCWL